MAKRKVVVGGNSKQFHASLVLGPRYALSGRDGRYLKKLVAEIEAATPVLSPFDEGWWSGWMRRTPDCPFDDMTTPEWVEWVCGYRMGKKDRAKDDAKFGPDESSGPQLHTAARKVA